MTETMAWWILKLEGIWPGQSWNGTLLWLSGRWASGHSREQCVYRLRAISVCKTDHWSVSGPASRSVSRWLSGCWTCVQERLLNCRKKILTGTSSSTSERRLLTRAATQWAPSVPPLLLLSVCVFLCSSLLVSSLTCCQWNTVNAQYRFRSRLKCQVFTKSKLKWGDPR